MNPEFNKKEIEKLFLDMSVLAAYLFGSRAADQSGPLSDIDIAVLLDARVSKDNYFDIKINLLSELMYNLKTNKIDLVILNEASPLLKYEVISSGKIIFNAGEDARLAFEVKTITEYIDTREIRGVYDSYFIEETLGALK